MLSTSAFLQAMIPLYIMGLIGFFSRRMGVLPPQANNVITQLMLYITLPALILYSLDGTFSVKLLSDFTWLVVMSVFIICIFVVAAAWLRMKANLPDDQKTVYESLIIFGNQGYMGFAVAYILLAEQGIIYLTIFNVFYLILIWSYGIYLFTKDNPNIDWKLLFFNPGILSTFIGVVMLFLPFQWPTSILDTFESVGKMTIPLSMILIGSLLADINKEQLRRYSKNMYIWIAAGCKLLIIPLFLLVFFLFQTPYPLILIAVLTSAMPSASTISVYAQKFGGDASFASFGVLISTLLCIVTIPLLYAVLQWVHHFF